MEQNIDDSTGSDQFPLSDLPTEVVLHVIKCLDERETSASFPTGPSVSRTQLHKALQQSCSPVS